MIAGLSIFMKYLLFLSAIIGLSVFATELSKEYIYNPSTDDAFIDDAFPAERKEYQASITRWDTVQLVDYDDLGNKRIVKTIRKQQINPEPVQPQVEQPTLELEEPKDRETTLQNTKIVVKIPWFGDYHNQLASYAYEHCWKTKTELWLSTHWKYGCKNQILTRNAENWWRNHERVSWKNSNWTRDHWFCQLNSRYHSKFINSDDFKNPLKQLEYCHNVRLDAERKGSMPWYAYDKKEQRNKGITFP